MKYLHVFSDEKWTNITVSQFLDSGQNFQEFIALYNENNGIVQYPIKKELPVKSITVGSDDYKYLLKNLSTYDIIFIHYLCPIKFEIINTSNSKTNIVWMCWGQDIHKMIIANSYAPLTRRLLLKNGFKNEYLWRYTLWLRQLKFKFSSKGKILKRVDYCCPVIQSDLDKTNTNLGYSIKCLPFHYGSLEQILGNYLNSTYQGTNILVGNSSSYASNHADVFSILKSIDYGNRSIIVPLNYGDEQYGNDISALGLKLFGENFTALRDFLDPNDYSKIIKSCSIAIFNHLRQQALGNILICLWMGIKVYLHPKGPLFPYLRGLGLPVYNIYSDLERLSLKRGMPLDKENLEKTRAILMAEFGAENTKKLTRSIFTKVSARKD